MLFFILYITVMIALKSFGEETEYLACVMLFMLLCWRPGSGDTVTDKNRGMGMYYKYKNCKEYNDSNPLYVQGCLREKSELSIFGSLKGLYICQLISLVILALAWIYLGVKHTYGQIRLIEVLLMACGFLLMIGWMGVKEYYKKRYDWASGYAEGKKESGSHFALSISHTVGGKRIMIFGAIIILDMRR